MSSFAALLRGINVGGKNKIPMAELKRVLSSLGLEEIATYVQSGNVIFRSPGKADEIAKDMERRISKDFGVNVDVLLRTPAQLRKIADSNPFLGDEPDLSKLHVVFLDGSPAAKAKTQLDPERSPPDRFDLRGREIYLHLPNGSARSKFTIDYFERRLGVRATARNWKTLTKLLALLQEQQRN
jgi:uncharacterized protein (DUF1697 family)